MAVDARDLPPEGRARDLADALREVVARQARGDRDGARRGLDAVRAAATRDAAAVARVSDGVAARLAEADTLAGRVTALGAKEAAVAARGGVAGVCAEAGEAARAEAARTPRRVDDLRRAVEAYEAALSGRVPAAERIGGMR